MRLRSGLLAVPALATLLLGGCMANPGATFAQEVLNLWNEYADICSQITDEASAERLYKARLEPLDKWWKDKAFEVRRQDIRKLLDKKEKGELFDMLNKDQSVFLKEGEATVERLRVLPKRMNRLISEEIARRKAAGDAGPFDPDKTCPYLLKAMQMRDGLVYDFDFTLPTWRSNEKKEDPPKMKWSFPRSKNAN